MKKILIALLATGILSTGVALAQPAGGGGAGGGRGGFQGRLLDDQQMTLYREAMQKDADKLRALDEKLRAAQKALLEATVAATYDENVVKQKAEEIAKIQVEITMLRTKGFATVAPTLKPEQKQQLVESRFAIMMLTGGGFDFMNRGGFQGGAQGRGNARIAWIKEVDLFLEVEGNERHTR